MGKGEAFSKLGRANYTEKNKTALLYHTINSDGFLVDKGPNIKGKTTKLIKITASVFMTCSGKILFKR